MGERLDIDRGTKSPAEVEETRRAGKVLDVTVPVLQARWVAISIAALVASFIWCIVAWGAMVFWAVTFVVGFATFIWWNCG